MSNSLTLDRGELALVVLMTLILSHGGLYAQGLGSIEGRVFDSKTGDPLPGSNVIVQNTSLGTATNLEGRFVIRNVPAGRRSIRASYIGYNNSAVDVTVVGDRKSTRLNSSHT